MSERARLLGVPNFSEGRNERVIGTLEITLGAEAEVLNVHSDAGHNRTVFTLTGQRRQLAEALVEGAGQAIGLIDMRKH